jgi:hypothetical protein
MRFQSGTSFPRPERILTIRCMAAAFAIAALSVSLIYGLA